MRRHPLDPLSAALGILAVAVGLFVVTGETDSLGGDAGVDRRGCCSSAWASSRGLLAPSRRGPGDEPDEE